MTETYNGAWNSVCGDIKETVQDIYHRYPVNKPVPALKEPVSLVCGPYSVSAATVISSEGSGS